MLEKLSVTKPYTILVAVIAAIALGVVSLMNMSLDLLPNLSLPYLVVVTAYPGASPEKVESEICIPMEQSLGTISGVKEVQSTCSENFGMIQLEFEEGTNIDSAMVKVSGALGNLEGSLPDECQTPNIMEISMDMLASMYVAVSKENADVYELTDYVKNDLIPYLERKGQVATINSTGMVEKTIQVDLNKEKIDELNGRILEKTNKALSDAAAELEKARRQVKDAQDLLDSQEKQFGSLVSSGIFGQASESLVKEIPNVQAMIQVMSDRLWEIQNGIYQAAGQAANMQNDLSQSAQRQNIAIDNVNKAAFAVDEARQSYTIAREDYLAALASSAQNWSNPESWAVSPGEEADLFTSDDVPAELYFGSEVSENEIPEPDYTEGTGFASTFTSEEIDIKRQIMEEAEAVLADAQRMLEMANAELAQVMGNANISAPDSTAGLSSGTGDFTSDRTARLEELIEELGEIQNLFNSVTVTDIVSGITRLASLRPRIEAVLASVRTWDVAGALSGVVANADASLISLSQSVNQLPELLGGLETAYAALTQGQLDAAMQFTLASIALSTADTQLVQAQAQYDSTRDQVLKSANMDALLSASTLSQMIYAQNFSMPAGYVDDEEDNSWLLKVGDEYESTEELAQTLLAEIDGIGSIRLSDIADVTMIDNAGDSFCRLNGEHAILLSIFKSPAAGTNQVGHEMEAAFKELEARDPGVHIVSLMNQGSYIDLIISDIAKSMLSGAALAFLVLILFLRNVRPTLLVALSIPLSLMIALVMMYFSGLSLNIMTLAGLALGIGMLVDNSIVVMENMFRLRSVGVDAPRAAVQGARQVSGSIIASTLTTICVFLPLAFTEGMVHELLVPMGLSIGYCLLASLITAMTVVPAAGSTILKKQKQRKQKGKSRILKIYEYTLSFCLKRKFLILALAIGLLLFCFAKVLQMGIVILPSMQSNQIQVAVVTNEEDTKVQSHEKASQVLDALLGVEGIVDIGVMDSSGLNSAFGGAAGGQDSAGRYTCLVTLDENAGAEEIERICREIEEKTSGIDCEVSVSGGGMADLSMMTSGNLSINIYGQDLNVLRKIGKKVAKVIGKVKGFIDINNGSQELAPTIHLVINRDQAMALGITTAQIYMKIMEGLTTSVTSTKIRYQGNTLDVVIRDETDPLTVENILDTEFDTSQGLGMSSGSAAMPGSAGFSAMGMSGMTMGSGDMSSFGDLSSMFGMGDDAGEDVPEDQDENEKEPETTVHKLSEFAVLEETDSLAGIRRKDSVRYLTVTAAAAEGYNITLLARKLTGRLSDIKLPDGYSLEIAGESSEVSDMLNKMAQLAILSLLFIYLIMVAQFQGMLSPMIVLFTIPLAFTGGLLGLLAAGRQLDMLALMGFVILMGTVVNNGIVFVDYTNQLRLGGLDRRTALIAAGSTRMRPILMTAMTTILAMIQLIIGDDMGNQLMSSMALVIASGLLYSTIMTLYIVPVMYDIFFKKQPLLVEVGENLDDIPDDAAQYLAMLEEESKAE